MTPFNIVPGFQRSPPGLEWAVWQRLPAILAWGTVSPLLVLGAVHLLWSAATDTPQSRALLLWDYTVLGVVLLHWTLVLTVAIGCFIVRVMKGPAYIADRFPPADEAD